MPVDHNNILIELNKAVKTLHFYPQGHPNLEAVLGRTQGLIKSSAEEVGDITWRVDKKGIFSGDTPVAPDNPATQGLTRIFFLRRIHELTFTKDITTADLNGFIQATMLEPDEVFAKGGVEKVLAAKRVRGILLNEMSYEDLARLEEEIPEEVEEEDTGTEDMEAIEEPPSDEETPEEERSLLELVKAIEKETDPLIYKDLSVRLMEQAAPLLASGNYTALFPAVYLFCWQSLPMSNIPREVMARAGECLEELLTPENIRYLIIRLTNKNEPKRQAIEHIIFKGGDEAVNTLLDTLVETREAHARRFIFNALVRFGDVIRDKVIERLSDQRWFVVRQMVALLGEIGGDEVLSALQRAYSHEDTRVKKEVLKSLARVPDNSSLGILASAVRDGDKGLKGQAIISLGIMKNSTMVKLLGETALNEASDIKKEAIKALGMVGDKKAVPYLSKILFKRTWFGKESNEELRSLAALSLAKIGGETAISAIEKVSGNSDGRLYSTCKRILDGARQ